MASVPVPFVKAQEYLLKRGITPELATASGIEIKSLAEAKLLIQHAPWHKYSKDSAVIVMPHHDQIGEPTDYYTGRVLCENKGWSNLVEKTAPKLVAPGRKVPRAHFPSFNHQYSDYSEIPRVYICESRLKADVVSAHGGGFAIGLNGCWGWSSKQANERIIKDLWEFPFDKVGQVAVLFDSNTDKANVWAAVLQLASVLRLRKVSEEKLVWLQLPKDPEGEDWGVDDYFAEYVRGKLVELLNSDGEQIDSDGISAALHQMNTEVAVVENISKYVRLDNGVLMTHSEMCNVHFADRYYTDEEGKHKPLPKLWNSWIHRRTVRRIAYRPGAERVSKECFNSWAGMGCEPREPTERIDLLTQFLENNVPDEDERRWLIQWMAYPVQHLGSKLSTCAVLIGEQGTGKSLLAHALGKVYGRDNYTLVTKENLSSAFNSAYTGKQFVVVDEMSKDWNKSQARALSNKLKTLISEETVMVNTKGVKEYEIENVANFMMTSNHLDALHLEDGDRRFGVIEFQPIEDRRHDVSYWNEFADYVLNHSDELYGYLLDVDMEGFSPKGHAILTEQKQEMIMSSYDDMEALALQLCTDGERETLFKTMGWREDIDYVESAMFLEQYFQRIGKPAPTQSLKQRLGNALRKFGAEKKECKIDGKVARMYRCATRVTGFNTEKARNDYVNPRNNTKF